MLHSELQQLGLPREHSGSIRRVTDEHYADIVLKLGADSLKGTILFFLRRIELLSKLFIVNPLEKCSIQTNKENNLVELNLEIGDKEKANVLMTPFTLDVLLENLKSIRSNMKELHDNPYVL